MGAGASKAPPDITVKSLEAKNIAQEIFRFMINQMKFEEYLTLANPDQCKKYVILIADSLQKFFMKVKILPDKTKDGYIYFRKFDDVKGATPMSQQYCLVIALFYVRIFQIYGALALSILDTDTNVYEFAHGGGLDALEDEEQVQSGGGLPVLTEEPLRSGDSLPSSYGILLPYLRRFTGNVEYYKFAGQYIFLKMSPFIVDGMQQYGMFFLYEPGSTYSTSSNVGKILCNMRIEPTDKGVKIILSGITIQEPKRKDLRLGDSTIRIARSASGILGVGDYGNLGEILNRRFLDILREASRERDDNDEEQERRDERRPGYGYRPEEKKEDTRVKEQFRTFALMERLKKIDSQPIKAHCIARALQLVSSKGLQKEFPQTIISNICDSKFYSAKSKRYAQSLPGMDEKITESRGIYTLWQLFFDKVLPEMSPDMSDATREKYRIASAYLSKAFANPSPVGIKDVEAKTASTYCSGKRDKQLKVDSKEAIKALRTVVGKMIETQAMHTAKVMIIFKKLFLIQPGKPITLHPNILEGGLPAVNAIGEEARSILVAYYANCEGLYGSGVQIIERSKAKILEQYY